MSKGDKPRPLSVSYKQYSDNYEAIFGKKEIAQSSTINKKKLQTKATRHKSSFVTRRQTRRISVAS